jgi:hypothetical protein
MNITSRGAWNGLRIFSGSDFGIILIDYKLQLSA